MHAKITSILKTKLIQYMLLSNFLTANLLVIVEFACQGDLLGYLLKSRGLPDTYYQTTGKLTTVTAKKLMMFAWQIADGMSFLSKNKVIKEGKKKWYRQKCGEIVPNFHQGVYLPPDLVSQYSFPH